MLNNLLNKTNKKEDTSITMNIIMKPPYSLPPFTYQITNFHVLRVQFPHFHAPRVFNPPFSRAESSIPHFHHWEFNPLFHVLRVQSPIFTRRDFQYPIFTRREFSILYFHAPRVQSIQNLSSISFLPELCNLSLLYSLNDSFLKKINSLLNEILFSTFCKIWVAFEKKMHHYINVLIKSTNKKIIIMIMKKKTNL